MKSTHTTHNAELNKQAWVIRRQSAKRLACSVMEISWKECLKMAKTRNKNYLDSVTKAWTASKSFQDLLNINDRYDPTLSTGSNPVLVPLADAFDACMRIAGRPNRIFRSCHAGNEGGFPEDKKKQIKISLELYRLRQKRKAQDNYRTIIKEMQY